MTSGLFPPFRGKGIVLAFLAGLLFLLAACGDAAAGAAGFPAAQKGSSNPPSSPAGLVATTEWGLLAGKTPLREIPVLDGRVIEPAAKREWWPLKRSWRIIAGICGPAGGGPTKFR